MKTFLRPAFCFLFLFFLSLLLVQCEHSEVPVAGLEKASSEKNPYAISAQEALEVAKNYENSQEGVTKQGIIKAGARVGADSEVVGEETVYDDTDKKPLFYIINKKKGFIIVSADLRTMPVIAYSEESQFNSKNMPEGVKMWFEDAKKKIKDVKKPDFVPNTIVAKEWNTYLKGKVNQKNSDAGARTTNTNCYEWYQYGQYMCQNSTSTYGPLMNTTWGQDYISSAALSSSSCGNCSRDLAGCGPVAMAQIYEYYNPSSKPRSSNSGCTPSNTNDQALAQLMASFGSASSSTYRYLLTCNTFTNPSNIPGAFTTMGFSNGGTSTTGINAQTIRNELTGNRPFLFWGSTCLSCFNDYHIWVCDGLKDNNYSEFDCNTLQCNQWTYTYVHMNWGWSGNYNGWYAFGQFNPGGNDYNSNLHTITGIRP